ncbi:site-2 protease family protein [Yinghuangia seranimata]|uniref:site-2 protease family protein n=1 Tax=Yinghuangia seranimata TaxID=408067 RepID=UPI00248AD96E|nr:site-2 protease family protein [Yinghuangia seranimata]MDI2126638.1 site-2 protease family protein [Yinghuangia seranimata]
MSSSGGSQGWGGQQGAGGGAAPGAGSGSGSGPGGPQGQGASGGGLLMGRPFGVPVYVSTSWFAIALIITLLFAPTFGRLFPQLESWKYLVAFLFAVLLYISVLVHELAHALTALRFGLPVHRITIQFLGGVSEIDKPETAGREFAVAAAGPALSLALAGGFWGLGLALDVESLTGRMVALLAVSNLMVAVFNLLPGLPLDGGRMLRAGVWGATKRPMAGTVAASWAGRVLAVAVLVVAVVWSRNDDGWMRLYTVVCGGLIAGFMWTGAVQSLRGEQLRERLPSLRVRPLTRRAIPVQADLPLAEALRRAGEAGAQALVVVDRNGEPMALVRESRVAATPQQRRPWVAVGPLARDLQPGLRVSAELAGEDLLVALRATPATEYLVVEEDGSVYGVLARSDVEKAFLGLMRREPSAG